ncbi:response regulator transcription factor [Gryllotalpicola protaetiae]|uniref:DNA-binding response regulator n=1 Tax=Gryllotalpicola protaetiae TaxID=2419771 RepID=A0A387BS34_9MICO|nr:response regulator transcription factor [Gryllotalpicola protaetiae]AYG03816.1 DNA-binding response regulator [Gryllotalpicola protaetiae]
MSERMPRLLLVEDDERLAPIVVEYLGETYEVTHRADGAEALQTALAGEFDVMVVDRRLPRLDGVSLVQGIRRAHIGTPIIMLTALGAVDDRVEGLDAGANDYLVKPFDFAELLARLRALRRTYTSNESSLAIGTWDFFPEDRIIESPYIGPVALTPKETELLRLLAMNPQRTFSRGQILQAVFSPTDLPGTVDTYVHYLRRKTEETVVLTVRGKGYRLGSL